MAGGLVPVAALQAGLLLLLLTVVSAQEPSRHLTVCTSDVVPM